MPPNDCDLLERFLFRNERRDYVAAAFSTNADEHRREWIRNSVETCMSLCYEEVVDDTTHDDSYKRDFFQKYMPFVLPAAQLLSIGSMDDLYCSGTYYSRTGRRSFCAALGTGVYDMQHWAPFANVWRFIHESVGVPHLDADGLYTDMLSVEAETKHCRDMVLALCKLYAAGGFEGANESGATYVPARDALKKDAAARKLLRSEAISAMLRTTIGKHMLESEKGVVDLTTAHSGDRFLMAIFFACCLFSKSISTLVADSQWGGLFCAVAAPLAHLTASASLPLPAAAWQVSKRPRTWAEVCKRDGAFSDLILAAANLIFFVYYRSMRQLQGNLFDGVWVEVVSWVIYCILYYFAGMSKQKHRLGLLRLPALDRRECLQIIALAGSALGPWVEDSTWRTHVGRRQLPTPAVKNKLKDCCVSYFSSTNLGWGMQKPTDADKVAKYMLEEVCPVIISTVLPSKESSAPLEVSFIKQAVVAHTAAVYKANLNAMIATHQAEFSPFSSLPPEGQQAVRDFIDDKELWAWFDDPKGLPALSRAVSVTSHAPWSAAAQRTADGAAFLVQIVASTSRQTEARQEYCHGAADCVMDMAGKFTAATEKTDYSAAALAKRLFIQLYAPDMSQQSGVNHAAFCNDVLGQGMGKTLLEQVLPYPALAKSARDSLRRHAKPPSQDAVTWLLHGTAPNDDSDSALVAAAALAWASSPAEAAPLIGAADKAKARRMDNAPAWSDKSLVLGIAATELTCGLLLLMHDVNDNRRRLELILTTIELSNVARIDVIRDTMEKNFDVLTTTVRSEMGQLTAALPSTVLVEALAKIKDVGLHKAALASIRVIRMIGAFPVVPGFSKGEALAMNFLGFHPTDDKAAGVSRTTNETLHKRGLDMLQRRTLFALMRYTAFTDRVVSSEGGAQELYNANGDVLHGALLRMMGDALQSNNERIDVCKWHTGFAGQLKAAFPEIAGKVGAALQDIADMLFLGDVAGIRAALVTARDNAAPALDRLRHAFVYVQALF